ncbi:DUF805 domain-containing protein [Oceanicaulis sp. MMSF_3324]|uniref:DUF805 domain-containing protein n=1 Tax=Oceanicaulis sp. MMSF_3324 TaxID=3046702 RepID=UPI00273D018D|nr:DUF805 domain-containing protein [Oceanicaulis sp. MMSF_3324]
MSLVASMMSANGRMAPADFQKAGLVLVAIAFVIGLTPLFLPVVAAGALSLIVSLALIYPWVCIWSKRLHDAGKSGWLFLVALVVWFVLLMIVNQIVTVMFGGESARMMAAAMETGNPDAIMQASEASSQATALPSAILSALVSIGMIFGANAVLKQDPEENRYGPVPGAEGAPEAMPAESPVETPEDPDQQ